ncbi:hypothetical protein OG371_07020 [Amycolatopsis sp. NBC_01480]|nr:hypothetical protein [Amycolatopsis sp. NBC_01480]
MDAGSGRDLGADQVSLHQPGRALGVGGGFGEERAEVRAGGVGVEGVDVRIDLVEVEDVRVLLVGDDLEAVGAGLVREGVAAGLGGEPDEVLVVLGRTVKETRNWYTSKAFRT